MRLRFKALAAAVVAIVAFGLAPAPSASAGPVDEVFDLIHDVGHEPAQKVGDLIRYLTEDVSPIARCILLKAQGRPC